MGEPCPKKNAGIFSGVEGKDSSAAFHSASVLGTRVAAVVDIGRNCLSVDVRVSTSEKRARTKARTVIRNARRILEDIRARMRAVSMSIMQGRTW